MQMRQMNARKYVRISRCYTHLLKWYCDSLKTNETKEYAKYNNNNSILWWQTITFQIMKFTRARQLSFPKYFRERLEFLLQNPSLAFTSLYKKVLTLVAPQPLTKAWSPILDFDPGNPTLSATPFFKSMFSDVNTNAMLCSSVSALYSGCKTTFATPTVLPPALKRVVPYLIAKSVCDSTQLAAVKIKWSLNIAPLQKCPLFPEYNDTWYKYWWWVAISLSVIGVATDRPTMAKKTNPLTNCMVSIKTVQNDNWMLTDIANQSGCGFYSRILWS